MRPTVAALAVATLLTLAGCSTSTNSTACDNFEDAHNRVTEAVSAFRDGTATSEFVKEQQDALPSRLQEALESASGRVATSIEAALHRAEELVASDDPQKSGTAFFKAVEDVAAACEDEGMRLTLTTID